MHTRALASQTLADTSRHTGSFPSVAGSVRDGPANRARVPRAEQTATTASTKEDSASCHLQSQSLSGELVALSRDLDYN